MASLQFSDLPVNGRFLCLQLTQLIPERFVLLFSFLTFEHGIQTIIDLLPFFAAVETVAVILAQLHDGTLDGPRSRCQTLRGDRSRRCR